MSKKTIFIFIVILILLAAGFFAYKKGYILRPEPAAPAWQKLLTLEIKDVNITPENRKWFEERFLIVKERLEKNSDDFDAWLTLGILKKGVADYEGAALVWLYAAQISPQSSPPFANLGDLYANYLNEPQKAEEAYKKAIANDPEDVNFYLGLADVYRYRMPGKEFLYEQTLLDALEILPDDANLIGPLAVYYRQTSQVEKAIEWYEKLVKISPENQTAREELEELKVRQR